MSNPLPQASDASLAPLQRALAACNRQVLGNPQAVKSAFIAFLAGGHLLIEDLPGTGKTTLARALAGALGLDFKRVQFTADLLPSDILGVSVYDPDRRRFELHRGPAFTSILLADEINRAPPRTQSALMEAMAEHQVSIDGSTHALPDPFFVIATQNPTDLSGTFALPDSQLDRFTLRIGMGYIPAEHERALLKGGATLGAPVAPAFADVAGVLALRAQAQALHCSDALIDYVQALVARSRRFPGIRVGLSPRAGLSLLAAAKANAFLDGHGFVAPNDVQAVFIDAAAHRIHPDIEGRNRELAAALLESVAVA
ncbi:MAG: AAA family ATPase [Arenimonas sp.]